MRKLDAPLKVNFDSLNRFDFPYLFGMIFEILTSSIQTAINCGDTGFIDRYFKFSNLGNLLGLEESPIISRLHLFEIT